MKLRMQTIPETERDQERGSITDKDNNRETNGVQSSLSSSALHPLQHLLHPTISVLLQSIHHSKDKRTLDPESPPVSENEPQHQGLVEDSNSKPKFLFNVTTVPTVCEGIESSPKETDASASLSPDVPIKRNQSSPLRPRRLVINGQVLNGNGFRDGGDHSLQVHSADILHLSPCGVRRFSQFNFNLRRFSQMPPSSGTAVLNYTPNYAQEH